MREERKAVRYRLTRVVVFRMVPIVLLVLAWIILTHPVAGQVADPVLVTARADVTVLTSDSLKGRGYVFDGHTKAAAYLRDRFATLGLSPVDGNFFQVFPLEVDLFPQAPTLAVNGNTLAVGSEFLPYPSSASGSVQDEQKIVRAGSGLVLPDQGVNEYAGLDIHGAVVVLEGTVPDSFRSNSAVDPYLFSKDARIQSAGQLGARAVVFLVDALVFAGLRDNAPVPAFDVLRGYWPEEQERVSFQVHPRRDVGLTSQNVMAVVPGTAVPDSFLIVSAHYDHVGAIGEHVYFPGANDNASGTAMLLSLAEYFTEHPLRYSILFVGFSGEEVGLIGSHYFAEHPPIDLRRVRAMLNLDMVASGQQGVMAVGGVDHPELYTQLEAANAAGEVIPLGRRQNVPNSDQWWLAQKGVPVLFLYTNRGTQPYHHVDDVPETLQWDDYREVYDLSRRFLERVDG